MSSCHFPIRAFRIIVCCCSQVRLVYPHQALWNHSKQSLHRQLLDAPRPSKVFPEINHSCPSQHYLYSWPSLPMLPRCYLHSFISRFFTGSLTFDRSGSIKSKVGNELPRLHQKSSLQSLHRVRMVPDATMRGAGTHVLSWFASCAAWHVESLSDVYTLLPHCCSLSQ